MRTHIGLRLPAVAAAIVAAAFLVGSAGAQGSLLAGTQQGSFFSPCAWTGPGPPPIETCTNTTPAVTASCDPAGDSTISFTTSGFIPTGSGGSFTETVTATIGPQDGPPAPAFQPFGFTGAQVGSIGLPTGQLIGFDASFTISTGDGRTITGTKSIVSDLANTGVCLELSDQQPPSTVFGAPMTGYLYIVNAQVLSYQATITDGSGSTADSGDAEAYLSDTYGTYDPTTVATADGQYLAGFGTTHPATGTTTSVATPTGSNVDSVPAPGIDITFSNVTGAGTTSVTELATAPVLPAGIQAGDPPMYYEVSTTADFTGAVKVCVPYGSTPAGAKPVLLHYENGAWVDVTTTFDDANRIVCGSVTSFSPFAAVFAPARPTKKTDCMNGGWKRYTNPVFKNEGDCVSYVATKGKNGGNG